MSELFDSQVVSKTARFSDTMWVEISATVAEAFRMTPEERKNLAGRRVAKLIAAIPFLAACEDAERTAVAHLGTYLLSVRETKKYFNARPEDSEAVGERLRLIANFKGGDASIIARGMNLLALNMISDYRRDAEEDVFLRKYNPVSSGDFDYEATAEELKERIEEIECPEMDTIMSTNAAPDELWWS